MQQTNRLAIDTLDAIANATDISKRQGEIRVLKIFNEPKKLMGAIRDLMERQ